MPARSLRSAVRAQREPHLQLLVAPGEPATDTLQMRRAAKHPQWHHQRRVELVQVPAQPLLGSAPLIDDVITMVDQQFKSRKTGSSGRGRLRSGSRSAALATASASSGSSQSTTTATTATSTQPAPTFTGPAHGTPAHENAENAVTGAAAAKAQAAAVKFVGRGTAGPVTNDMTGTGFETTVTKADGSTVEVHLDSSLNAFDGHGGGPDGPDGSSTG